MKWYKHDPDAFIAGTTELTLEEVGAYILLINLLYSRDGNVPDDDRFMARALRCRPQVWRRLKAELIAKGKVHEIDGKLTANRVETTLKEAANYAETAAKLGRLSGVSRRKSSKINEKNEPTTTTTTTTSRKKESSTLSMPRTRAKTPFPDGWEPPLDLTERTEFEKFKASALAHGRVYANWEQAWRNWKLNAPNFKPARNLQEHNREIMDDLQSFIKNSVADANGGGNHNQQTDRLLPFSKAHRP